MYFIFLNWDCNLYLHISVSLSFIAIRTLYWILNFEIQFDFEFCLLAVIFGRGWILLFF